jgi:uncharacterized protein YdhG (YjbR/CyaY superfamily)
MDRSKEAPASIDEYISWFPDETQKKLQEMRATIHAAAPEATEKISYQMPTFFLNGNLVHFAGFKDHISFFPGAISNISEAFGDEIASYMTGKGTLQFPFEKPIPLELVSRITKYRTTQNLEKTKSKSAGKKKT